MGFKPLAPLIRPLRVWLEPWLNHGPAARLIRATARHQWKLIALNLASSLVEVVSEAASFGVIFLATDLLSSGVPINWLTKPVLSSLPQVTAWLDRLSPTRLFLLLLGLAVVLQALQALSRYANAVSRGYFAARCRARITAAIHSRILSLSFACASHYRVGDLANYPAQGAVAVQTQIEVGGQLLVNALLVLVYLAVLTALSPWLLLVAVGIGVVLTLVQKQLLPRIRRSSQQLMQLQVAIASRITENIQALRWLHSSGQLALADQAVQGQMTELERSLRRQTRQIEVVGPLSSLLPILSVAVIAALSVVVFGARSTGVLPSLVTFVLALQRLNGRLGMIAANFNSLSNNSGSFERLNAILSAEGKEFRRSGGVPFERLEREIRFEAVSLAYPPGLPESVSDVSFRLPKGGTVALVGPSGAGKSSIADLLVGLYEPTRGRILVDGVELSAIDPTRWQQRLGVVSQDTFLFNATIAENIAMGCPWAGSAEIRAAAAEAQAAGFIEALPAGYDTLIGERGYRLSGGQRQRLSLARAILRQPELLILDEATSALDSESEQLVQQALERFEAGHTVLLIAHRLSTIVNADQILVLRQGGIIERGTHAELLALAGAYARAWAQQADAAGGSSARVSAPLAG